MDLTDELERSIPTAPIAGPVLPSAAERLQEGRRIRRRRRTVGGLGTLAVGVLVAGGVTLVDLPAQQDPPSAGGVEAGDTDDQLWRTMDPVPQLQGAGQAFYDTDGSLVVRDGAEVLKRLDDLPGVEPPVQSVALVTRWHGNVYWTFAWNEGDDATSSTVAPTELPSSATFGQWVADMTARTAAEQSGARYVTLDADGGLVPAQMGVVVLQQTTDVPAGMLREGEPAAVGVIAVGDAELCVGAADGDVTYQSAREHGPDLSGCREMLEGWHPYA